MLTKFTVAGSQNFRRIPDLDANANAVAHPDLKLENEGWERDYDVTEPSPNRPSPDHRCSRFMRPLSAAQLLEAWERGLARPGGVARSLCLQWRLPIVQRKALLSLSVGERDRRLLKLRE